MHHARYGVDGFFYGQIQCLAETQTSVAYEQKKEMKPRAAYFSGRGLGFRLPCLPAEGKLLKHASGQMFLGQGALRIVVVLFRENMEKGRDAGKAVS